MDLIKIVPITSDNDLFVISDLADKIWHQHFNPLIGEKQVDYMLEHFQCYDVMCRQVKEDGYEYFFLAYNNINVGYTAFIRDESSVFLSKIYILEEYRGKKIAKVAIQYMIDLCRKNGLSKIWLTVNRLNLNTIMVYQKIGFKIVSEQKKDIGNGFYMDDYIMEFYI